jgi:uncharacterized RDD family membrane protein YckC
VSGDGNDLLAGVQSNNPPEELDYQVVGLRLCAALIDIAVLFALFVVMSVLFGDTSTSSTRQDGNQIAGGNISLTGAPFLLYLALVFVYCIWSEAVTGKTLGKLIMGIKVVRSDGDACGLRGALLRNVLRVIDGLPVGYIVGLACIAATEQKQRLGDLAADTLVVRDR